MVEREQRRGRDEDEAEIAAAAAPSDTALVPRSEGETEAKDRDAAFRAALDMIMADHHNVLAALAK